MASIQALRTIRALVRLGWMVVRASGSHHVLVKPGFPRIVVPVHRGKPLMKDAGVSEEEFFDVY